MPRIGEADGLAIYMHFNDHLPPHCHARTGGGEREGRVAVDPIRMLPDSTLNAREERAATGWVAANLERFHAAWAAISQGGQP